MSIYIILLIIILLIIIIILLYKLFTISISIKEIKNNLNNILNEDTNRLITISSNNKELKELTNNLNKNIKELNKQKIKYQNGNQEIENTITDLTHDIRTPLTSIRGYIDLLEKEKLTKKQKEYLKVIDKSSNTLVSLTEELFDYSKSFNLKNNQKIETLCLNNILENVIISYYALFKEKKLIPKINICKEKIYIKINQNMLTRVLENIISNIIKYSDDNIEIILQSNGKLLFSNKTKKLDSINIEKIFNRYYTVENGSKKSGIGLSIAKQIIASNNGKINASYKNNILLIEISFNIYKPSK